MKSIYEQSGGTYHQNGDYLIPDIALPEQSEASIGTWGRRHLRYIRENRPMLYNGLLLQNTLWEYLEGIETQARDRLQSEMGYLLLLWNVDEELKARDQMTWVQKMNQARSVAEEIVNAELIYV